MYSVAASIYTDKHMSSQLIMHLFFQAGAPATLEDSFTRTTRAEESEIYDYFSGTPTTTTKRPHTDSTIV